MPTPPKPVDNMTKNLTEEERQLREQAEKGVLPDRGRTSKLEKPAIMTRNAAANRYWRKVLDRMDGLAILDDLDSDALGVYCVMMARYEQQCRLLTVAFRSLKDAEGDPEAVADAVSKLDTLSGKMQSVERNILQYAEKLGLPAVCAWPRSGPRRRPKPKIRTVTSLAIRWQSGLHHPVSVYAKQVTQGRLRAQCCKYEILACQRHLDDLKRQGTDGFPYVFDTTRADRIIRWFGQCIQIRGVDAGKPIELEPWQVFDLGCTYGWVHRDTGARRFTHTYNKRARGNYKSTEKSGQGLYHMCGDACYPPYHPELAVFEQEPEVECAAVDRTQAMRVFGDAKKIARASPSISKRLLVPRSNPIVHVTRGGYMRALSKETKNKDSGAPSYFVVDEYHAHPNSEIYDLGTNSFGKRRQSLLDVITTAGDDALNKPCYIEETYAKRVLEDPAVTDESYFVMIRELDEGDNPHDERLWAKANPCLRCPSAYSAILFKQIQDEHNAAYSANDPNKIRKFLTRRMCLWQVGSVNRYLDERCMALARKAMVPPEGYCTLTPGAVTDNSYVYNWICAGEREHSWAVDEVDYDGHNATDLAIRMNEDRNRDDWCVEVSQTCAGQNLAVKTFRELLLRGQVVMEYNPMVLWCLGNAVEIQNNYGDIKLSKRHKDDTERIDPVAAAMNALARLLVKKNDAPDLAQALRRPGFSL